MSLNRRQFLQLLGYASVVGTLPGFSRDAYAKSLPAQPADLYEVPKFGNVSLLHITDTHAQLNPIYFREPNVNLGLGGSFGQPPHLVGEALLKQFAVERGSAAAHAYTYLDFVKEGERFGKVGGFAHLSTLIQRIRHERGAGNSLLLDGGDTWQGSGTALWSRGKDMVKACNLLGVDIMTGHWEFTYLDHEVLDNIADFKGEFVAQNIRVKEDALFDYEYKSFSGFNEESGHAFKPYTLRSVGGAKVAVIGQAFPYTPIANPARFIPNWSFGIRDQEMQELVDRIRATEKPDLVVVLSHNGMDVDLKMASVVSGIDVILGGHTHDGVPAPSIVKNRNGQTLVTNAGSNGKYLGVLDLDVKGGKLHDWRYRLLPVFSNLIPADPAMQSLIETVRAPYLKQLQEPLAVAGDLLYRRGNFNGSFDQLICDAQRVVGDAQIGLSPGFRWGTTILPGQTITMEHLLDQTGMTYPETYVREMSGAEIKTILEDVLDNLFNSDPYRQQGGDMVRVSGLDYTCDPTQPLGQRVSDLRLEKGSAIEAAKKYRVAGWATVSAKSDGVPVWEVVATYLRDRKTVEIKRLNTPLLKGVKGNPGVADYAV